MPLEERTHRNYFIKKFNSENFSIGGIIDALHPKTCTISILIASHQLEYIPESMHVLEIVNRNNRIKSEFWDFLKVLVWLIHQSIRLFYYFKLSDLPSSQKFTIQELRPFLHIENIIISTFITLIHIQKVIHKQPNRLKLHTENVKKSEENSPFLSLLKWL